MSNTVQACLVLACGTGLKYMGLPDWIAAFLFCALGCIGIRILQCIWQKGV